MVSAVTRVGEAIASAAGVVIAAFLALLASTLSVLRSMGPALAIAVAVTLIAGLTLIPAESVHDANVMRRTSKNRQGDPVAQHRHCLAPREILDLPHLHHCPRESSRP
jgi:multidrug efflux pump subunit AcrB